MSDQSAVIIPFNLGPAAKYDRRLFPLAYHGSPGSSVSKGSLLLSATMDEIIRIRDMQLDLSNSGDFLYNTRIEYEALKEKRSKLQKKGKTYNPFKLFQHYRAARLFHAAAWTLWCETRETSEQMQREHAPKSVPSAQVHAVSYPIPEDAVVSGIVVPVPGGADANTIRAISDATGIIVSHASESFVEGSFLSQLGDVQRDAWIQSLADTDAESLLSLISGSSFATDESDETPDTSTIGPSSPQSITINITGDFYNNSILSTNSNLHGVTANHGTGNTGASLSQ